MLKETAKVKVENPIVTDWVRPAVEILLRGGVVAFPTETVYGLAAAPGVPGALDKLNRLKKRPTDKPYTVHVGSEKKLYRYVPNPPWFARVLARKAWPGPLTLVVELTEDQVRRCRETFGELFDKLYHENTIGLRCPDHPAATHLLNGCELPVVAPSANPADEPPALNASQVEEYFGDQVDLILDGGPVKYRKASTVVKVTADGYEVLRKGILDHRAVDKLASFLILFVCSGNTCRSPMAAGLCRRVLPKLLERPPEDLAKLKIAIASAGTYAGKGMPAARAAVAALSARGVDISDHRSQPATVNLIKKADVIYVMSPEHKEFILDLVPEAANRIQLLSEFGVPDPIGGSDLEYVDCAANLETLIEARLKELLE